ncbi:Polyketide cyclase WhiE VII [Pseudonocardia sp. Ae717_Ps2]|uniref:TcmI family type II polyketide cyclase n=1 Tax=Pseudonocardia sp. Ae717_Ps2 TaxID=1885573 RepID=UPI00096006A1|nr:TcmI family type II polyketide cyclase [Pseudonocardia sp. Ae717_Ps2]OLM27802.1 Polyketide cyclase WhiE VII [Pseudonocardia sp. Ae717_Ps2]
MSDRPVERTLMVARMPVGRAEQVARLFAESDATGLPQRMGVRHRALYSFHGVYAHLIEAEPGLADRIRRARAEDPGFGRISAAVDALVKPWDPQTWRGPLDSQATSFYRWSPE